MHNPFAPREAKARTVQIIEVAFPRGEGIEGDPVRQVVAYFDLDGEFLAERDDWYPPNLRTALTPAPNGEPGWREGAEG